MFKGTLTLTAAFLTLGLKMLFTSGLAPFCRNLPSLPLLTPQTITIFGRGSTPSLHDHNWLEHHWSHDVESADLEVVLLPIACVVWFAKVNSAHQLFVGFELRSRGNSHSKVKSIVSWVSRAWLWNMISPYGWHYTGFWGGWLEDFCVCPESVPMKIFLGYP